MAMRPTLDAATTLAGGAAVRKEVQDMESSGRERMSDQRRRFLGSWQASYLLAFG